MSAGFHNLGRKPAVNHNVFDFPMDSLNEASG